MKGAEIKLNEIGQKLAQITIVGDGELQLNKMNARNVRQLMAEDRKKVKEEPNIWEDLITSLHWRDPIGTKDTYKECNEALYNKLLKENAPCITGFGLKRSWGDAVVRNEIDKYKTKFETAVNVVEPLVPVTFAHHEVEERLMAPKKGSPVCCRLHHFGGWTATFTISYTTHVYSLQEIINIINLAGFGGGIGSGRTSGYGRYHVSEVGTYE